MSPFRSEAQRRKFHLMEKRGEIKKGTSERWEKHTKAKLPARIGKPKRKGIKKFMKRTLKVRKT